MDTPAEPAPLTNPHKGRRGWNRLVRATGHSLAGLRTAYLGESAFRLEVRLAAVMLPIAWWIGRSWLEVAVLAGSVLLVLVVELLNTSLEAAVDRVSFEFHELSKHAKDMASAAVFLSMLLCAGIWLAAIFARWAP